MYKAESSSSPSCGAVAALGGNSTLHRMRGQPAKRNKQAVLTKGLPKRRKGLGSRVLGFRVGNRNPEIWISGIHQIGSEYQDLEDEGG